MAKFYQPQPSTYILVNSHPYFPLTRNTFLFGSWPITYIWPCSIWFGTAPRGRQTTVKATFLDAILSPITCFRKFNFFSFALLSLSDKRHSDKKKCELYFSSQKYFNGRFPSQVSPASWAAARAGKGFWEAHRAEKMSTGCG